ncbi:glycosyl hydrolase family 28-related protein [Granulicella sibirica]|uniref:Rhamnogalacturonase A/B/Epimerase-like pectate lyase domain-containing protein n=1 Tax=Granulicella sibirica TaxID=2479048 RepID=A0A4V1L612_9BACT|nr:glycosyl hydrolase family 28-related protein [Granulicella sibirica]RXH57654.1 hypothetical protein GRAN_0964 [Granulicella sibirica]
MGVLRVNVEFGPPRDHLLRIDRYMRGIGFLRDDDLEQISNPFSKETVWSGLWLGQCAAECEEVQALVFTVLEPELLPGSIGSKQAGKTLVTAFKRFESIVAVNQEGPSRSRALPIQSLCLNWVLRKLVCSAKPDWFASSIVRLLVITLFFLRAEASAQHPITEKGPTTNVSSFGAKCDGTTDDTAAFQAAANAARDAFRTGQTSQVLTFPMRGCVIGGQITLYSGTHLRGGGTILVPVQRGHTLYTQNSDDVSITGVNIVVIKPGVGGPDTAAIAWYAVGDSSLHTSFYVQKCNVRNSGWGILAVYNNGTGSLTDVDISDNIVTSDEVYTNGDGIHVAGKVSGIKIHDNRVLNRGDAGIALTSEFTNGERYVLSGAIVSNNILLEDRVGLDDSGATDAVWRGNHVRATIVPRVSPQNPAFRQIFYGRTYPTGVQTLNNDFTSGDNSGASATVKIDPMNPGQTRWPDLHSSFEKNVIHGPNAPLYIRGSGLSVKDNTFSNGGAFIIDYDGSADQVATSNIELGTNKWLAPGSIRFGRGCGLYSNVHLQPQSGHNPLHYENLPCIGKQSFTPADDSPKGKH